jgi:hypothetical protein
MQLKFRGKCSTCQYCTTSRSIGGDEPERVRALRLKDHIVLPAGCPVSVREFLSEPATQTVHINRARLVSAHGLFGLTSNRGTAVLVQKLKFGEFCPFEPCRNWANSGRTRVISWCCVLLLFQVHSAQVCGGGAEEATQGTAGPCAYPSVS